MEDDLSGFLEAAAGWTHDLGRRDCLLFIADWVVVRTGVDPAAPWRGRYRSEAGAARIIARAGGVLALLDDGLVRAGLARRDPGEAQAGDVGLVERMTPAGPGLVGAVCDGRRWASLMAHGIHVAPGEAAALWRIA